MPTAISTTFGLFHVFFISSPLDRRIRLGIRSLPSRKPQAFSRQVALNASEFPFVVIQTALWRGRQSFAAPRRGVPPHTKPFLDSHGNLIARKPPAASVAQFVTAAYISDIAKPYAEKM